MLRKLLVFTLTAAILTNGHALGPKRQEGADAVAASSAQEQAAYIGTQTILESFIDFDTGTYLTAKEYPKELVELYNYYPETKEFVLQYFEKKDQPVTYDLSADLTPGEIPHLLQWDMRWGYQTYYDEIMAVSGCGPMALAMVGLGLTGDTETFDPLHVAAFSAENGFYVAGSGTSWLLMGDGARMLGLTVHDVELSVEGISASIRAGRPVICSMGPGDFTETGHFIVLYDVDDSGSVAVRDPVSISRTGKRWDLASLIPQIKILWGYSAE